MTGPVDWQQLASVLAIAAGAIGAFLFMYKLITAEGDKSRAAVQACKEELTKDFEQRFGVLTMKINANEANTREFTQHIAENYVMKDSLKEVLEGNREIRESINTIHSRLDRVLEIAVTGSAPAPARRRAAG